MSPRSAVFLVSAIGLFGARAAAAQIDAGVDLAQVQAIGAAPAAGAELGAAGPTGESVAAEKSAGPTAQAEAALSEWDKTISDFDKLRTPDSPAMALLGTSPMEIQRPGTPTALATTLGGFVSGTSIVIPKNLGVEIAPYWLLPHRDLTARQYEDGGARNIYRTLTVSLASKQTDRQATDAAGAVTTHTDTDLGVGMRLRLFGWGPDKSKACLDQVEALQSAAASVSVNYILSQKELAELLAKYPQLGSGDYLNAFHELQEKRAQEEKAKAQRILEDTRSRLDKKCLDVTASTQGWSGSLAGAADFYFADSQVTRQTASTNAGAAWLNIAYATDWTTGILLARYAARKVSGDWQNLLDGGMRLSLKGKTFALSGEGIARWRVSGPGNEVMYKIDVTVEYEVRDQVWASLAFGKNYDSGQSGALFTLANLSWGFGKPTSSDVLTGTPASGRKQP